MGNDAIGGLGLAWESAGEGGEISARKFVCQCRVQRVLQSAIGRGQQVAGHAACCMRLRQTNDAEQCNGLNC